MNERNLRRGLVFAAVTSILSPGWSAAQEVPASGVQEEGEPQEIIVTSSRIRRPEDTFSNPVVAVDSETIRYSGRTDLTEFLMDLPAFVGSTDANDAAGSNTFIGGTGLTLLDLRNLEEDRTLVLIDGRRHVAALPGSAAVDVDTIPIALIERIEVQTGGASAIYGADGVSGVVNFIMKKDFEGVDTSLQYGRATSGGGQDMLASVVAGMNFLEDRGNIAVGLEYAKEDRLKASERSFARSGNLAQFVGNPEEWDGDDPNVADNIPVTDIRYWDSSRNGVIYVDTVDGWLPYNGNGDPWDFGTRPPNPDGSAPYPSIYQQGGDGTALSDYIGDLIPERERFTGNLFGHFDLSERLRLFGELKYSRTEAFSESQPTFDFFMVVMPENPYVPDAITALGDPDFYEVSRDNFDLGVRYEDITRETIRSVLGLGGDITDNVRYEVSYVYGQTEVDNFANDRFEDRWFAAIDSVIDPSTGQPTCRSNLDPDTPPVNYEFGSPTPLPGTWAGSFTPGPNSGCIPVNLFVDGGVSPEAAAWIMVETLSRSKIEQHVAQAYVSGDSREWFSLPAGPLGFALGAEWREESSRSIPPIENQNGLVFGNILAPEFGEFDVAEVFAEISVPLLSRRPFAQVLSFDAAVRYSDYSTTGAATTWKTGLIWSPHDIVTLRGTVAEATRAPNIGELFSPAGQTFQPIDDPCDIRRLDEGSSTRAANCAQLLTALGVDPTTFINTTSAFIPGTLQGNRDLTEEVAETTTAGIVFRPITNFAIALDWYDIKLTEAINTALPEEAAAACVDAPSIDNQFCDLVSRDPTTGFIDDFLQIPQNVAELRTEGYDFTIQYTIPQTSAGSFGLRLIGNKLVELTFINLPGAEPDEDLGEADRPEWQTSFDTTWQWNALVVNYGVNYFSSTQRYTLQERRGDPDIVDPELYDYSQKLTHDIQVRYTFSNGLGLFGGINNFTNEEPDLGELAYPVSPVGRFWYIGANFASF